MATLREQIVELIRHNCGREEIRSAMLAAGSDRGHLDRVIRQLADEGIVPRDPSGPVPVMPPADMTYEYPDEFHGEDPRRTRQEDRRLAVYEAAINRTFEEVCEALPNESPRYIRETLQSHCKPFLLKQNQMAPVLKLEDGRYVRAKDNDLAGETTRAHRARAKKSRAKSLGSGIPKGKL